MEAQVAVERQTHKSATEALTSQLQQFAQRLDQLESVRVEQEGTIKIKQEETHQASQKISVG